MNVPWPLVLLICVLLLGAVLHWFLPAGRSRTRGSTPADRDLPDVIFRNDDRYWFGGFFSNNPDDPDLFVPKRWGLGWTVNVGHPLGKPVMIGTLLLPLALAMLTVLAHH